MGDWTERCLLAVGVLLLVSVLVTYLQLRRRPKTLLKRQEEALLADLHSSALRVIQAEHFLAASEAEVDEIILRLPLEIRERAVARGIIGASIARLGRQEVAAEGDEKRFSSPDERRDSGEVPVLAPVVEAGERPLEPGSFAVAGKVFAFKGGKLRPQ